ncbi:MAG TPA: hypothetical protein VIO38_08380 [Rariglobus sp.]
MGRKKQRPRVTVSPGPTLDPSTVDIRDLNIALEDRRRLNQDYHAAHTAYDNYVRFTNAAGFGAPLAWDAWVDTQVRGAHPTWHEVAAMEHPYSLLPLSLAEAQRRVQRFQALAAGGRRGRRVPMKILATKAAGRPLPTCGAPSASSRSSAAAAAAGADAADGGDDEGDMSDGEAVASVAGAASPLVDLTGGDTDTDLGDAADFAPDDDDVMVLSVRSAPVSRAVSDTGAALASAGSVSVHSGAGGRSRAGAAAASAGDRSLVLRLPLRPAESGATASAPLVCPFHVYARGQPPRMYVRSAPPPVGVVDVFRPPASGPFECRLRYGPSTSVVKWTCGHAGCPSGTLEHLPSEPHYWCGHHYDLCVRCANQLAAADRGGGAPLRPVPLVDEVTIEFDSYGRETVTKPEGAASCLVVARRSKKGITWLPFSICRIHHSSPVVRAPSRCSAVRADCSRRSVLCSSAPRPAVPLLSPFLVPPAPRVVRDSRGLVHGARPPGEHHPGRRPRSGALRQPSDHVGAVAARPRPSAQEHHLQRLRHQHQGLLVLQRRRLPHLVVSALLERRSLPGRTRPLSVVGFRRRRGEALAFSGVRLLLR